MKLSDFKRSLHFRAVLIGFLTGLVLGIIVGPIEILFLFGSNLTGTTLHIWSLILGSIATLIAAYVTAHLSATDKFLNVVAFWVINEALGILSLFFSNFPLWYNLIGAVVIIVASVLGWYFEKLLRQ